MITPVGQVDLANDEDRIRQRPKFEFVQVQVITRLGREPDQSRIGAEADGLENERCFRRQRRLSAVPSSHLAQLDRDPPARQAPRLCQLRRQTDDQQLLGRRVAEHILQTPLGPHFSCTASTPGGTETSGRVTVSS